MAPILPLRPLPGQGACTCPTHESSRANPQTDPGRTPMRSSRSGPRLPAAGTHRRASDEKRRSSDRDSHRGDRASTCGPRSPRSCRDSSPVSFYFTSIFYPFGPEPVVRSMREHGKWPPAIPKWLRILYPQVVPLSPASLVLLEPRRNQPLIGQKINQVVDVRGPAAPDAPAMILMPLSGSAARVVSGSSFPTRQKGESL